MKPIKEAELIVQKENLTLDDYNRFVELGDETNKEEEYEYGWLCEAFVEVTGNSTEDWQL